MALHLVEQKQDLLYAYVLLTRLFFFFFFSSRRRHTRLQGDWSSDVCSSDLGRRSRERRSEAVFGAAASPRLDGRSVLGAGRRSRTAGRALPPSCGSCGRRDRKSVV